MTKENIVETKNLKESAFMRWSMLLLISVIMFGSYYFYDVFSGIKVALQTQTGMTNSGYGLMIGFYSFANFFLAMTVLGGIILDKWGIRKTGLVFIFFMTLGSVLTAYGASNFFQEGTFGYSFLSSFLKGYSPELKMMLIGRLLFGFGAETAYVVINKVMVKWFKGKELALAFGLNLAVARFGTAAAFIVSPIILKEGGVGNLVKDILFYVNTKTGVTTSGWLGATLVMVGLLAFIFYTFFDKKYDKRAKQIELESGIKVEEENFRFADLVKLLKNKSFLFITFLCVTFYSAVFPFLSYAPDFLHNKFGFSIEASGQIATILPFGTIIFTPLFGWYTDKKGKSASIMIYGSILLILVHLTLSLTLLTPYLPIFILGIAFSLVPAAMWPSVAKIVDENRLGTAYGFMFFIQNLGLYAFPWLVGKILDITNKDVTAEMVEAGKASYDYTYAILTLAGLGFLGIIFALLLKRDNKKSGYGLELPNKQE